MIETWVRVKDGDPAAHTIMSRHYTYHDYKDGRRHRLSYRNRKLFVGPGNKIVLVTPNFDALFVWRKFKDDSGQRGVNCAVFRNEGNQLSSDLILEAERFIQSMYPGERMYTYVDAKKVKSTNPGYCFIKAGWHKVGKTKSGLIILAKSAVMPELREEM